MKNVMRILMVLAVVLIAGTSCKSKQKITEIAGGNIPAVNNNTSTSTSPVVTAPVVTEPEVTRNEVFTLSEGDQSAMKFKYHVVVGSFKSQSNAKGLQTTLVSEGNKAIVVINEQGMYRVLIASYNEYMQARTKINEIKSRFADAWVLVQK